MILKELCLCIGFIFTLGLVQFQVQFASPKNTTAELCNLETWLPQKCNSVAHYVHIATPPPLTEFTWHPDTLWDHNNYINTGVQLPLRSVSTWNETQRVYSYCIYVRYVYLQMTWQPIALHQEALIFNWMELLHFVEYYICSFMAADFKSLFKLF